MNTLKDFSIGDKVVLKESVLHKVFAGKQGMVSKLLKSRNTVRVLCNDGLYYDHREHSRQTQYFIKKLRRPVILQVSRASG